MMSPDLLRLVPIYVGWCYVWLLAMGIVAAGRDGPDLGRVDWLFERRNSIGAVYVLRVVLSFLAMGVVGPLISTALFVSKIPKAVRWLVARPD